MWILWWYPLKGLTIFVSKGSGAPGVPSKTQVSVDHEHRDLVFQVGVWAMD